MPHNWTVTKVFGENDFRGSHQYKSLMIYLNRLLLRRQDFFLVTHKCKIHGTSTQTSFTCVSMLCMINVF